MAQPQDTDVTAPAVDCLGRGAREATEAAAERRHEVLMERAEAEGLDREFAEKVYLLAEEEELEPVYAFLLVRCGVGVRELEPPEVDPDDDAAAQQAPPGWVGAEQVELDDVVLERRLRATFRRFRAMLASHSTTDAAVQAFVGEADVADLRLRP